MAQVSLDQPVTGITIRDLQALIEDKIEEALRTYEVRRRDYLIDDEGYLCFSSEEAYAEYLDKQGRRPSEVRAYYTEHGMKMGYSDYDLSPKWSAELEKVHQEIETGAPLIGHDELRKRLGV